MSETHSPGSREKVVPTDTIWRIGKMVTTSLAKIVDMFLPSGKN